MSIDLMNQVWKHANLTGTKLIIMLALADMANDEGICFPSIETIAHKARVNKRNTQQHIRDLVADGYISREENFVQSGRQTSNIYKVLPIKSGNIGSLPVSPATGEGVASDRGEDVGSDTPEGVASDIPINPHSNPHNESNPPEPPKGLDPKFERILRIRTGSPPSTIKLSPIRSHRERKAWAKIAKSVTDDEIAIVERFYALKKSERCDATWKRKENPDTLMNNWAHQVELATEWFQPQPALTFERVEPANWREIIQDPAFIQKLQIHSHVQMMLEDGWEYVPFYVQEAIRGWK